MNLLLNSLVNILFFVAAYIGSTKSNQHKMQLRKFSVCPTSEHVPLNIYKSRLTINSCKIYFVVGRWFCQPQNVTSFKVVCNVVAFAKPGMLYCRNEF